MKNRIILAVALSIGLAASASAQIIMTNPGFELPNVASGGWTRYSITAFPGWTLIPGADAGRTFVNGEGNANMLKSPTSGDQSLGLSASSTLTQGLYQSLGTLQANTDYSFSYEIGFRPTNNASMTYRIGLWGDTTGDNLPDTPLSYRTQTDDAPVPNGPVGGNLKVISSATVNSSTFAGAAIGNQFFFYIDTVATDAAEELLVDNVGVIPEPSVALLLGAAGMFHFILRRRRR